MNYGSEPADQVVRYSLEGAEFALRISGTAAKNFFIFAQAVLHDSKKTHGKTHLIRLLKEQKPLKFFTVDKDRMHDFARAAKAHGLLFCPIRDKMDPDHIEIAILQGDASKANRIIDKLQLAIVDTGTAELIDTVQQERSEPTPETERVQTEDGAVEFEVGADEEQFNMGFPQGSENASPSEPFSDSRDLNKYLNETAAPETQYSKEEYAAMKKTEREAVWLQVDARMGEVLADAPTLQGFLDFMSQCRNSLPNQLLLSGQNADITDARTFQQWKDAGRHIRTGEEGYTAIVGQVYENNGRKASGYNIGKVFDITQTRGRPVPPPAEYQVDELIAASIESSPVPIQISDSLPDGIQAQYVPKNRTIYVRNGMDAGTTLCAIVRECAQADFHKDYTYNRQAYAAPSYCAAYMVAHRYGLDTTAFNFDRVVALYRNLGKEQQRGFLSDVNIVGGGLLRSLSRTLAVQTRELPAAEYAVAIPAKKQSRQRERG